MNHLKWMGHTSTILEIPKSLRRDVQSCEVTLVAKGHAVKAHRFVLSSCSDLLRSVMADVPIGNECTIMLPDANGETLDKVLAFIYLGETCVNSTNLSEFLETINSLGVTSAMNFQCSISSFSQTPNLNDGVNSSNNIILQKVNGNTAAITISAADIIANAGILSDKLNATNMMAGNNAQTNTANTANNAGDLDFLDVYPEQQHQKITYSIEPVPDTNHSNEYILTETTVNNQIMANNRTAGGGDVNEDDGIETDILDDYSTAEDPLLHMNENVAEVRLSTQHNTNTSCIEQRNPAISIIHDEVHMKRIKLKGRGNDGNGGNGGNGANDGNGGNDGGNGTIITTKTEETLRNDPISILGAVLKVNAGNEMMMDVDVNVDVNVNVNANANANANAGETIEKMEIVKNATMMTSMNMSAADLAYQAMLSEGISLPKAAMRFNVSKTELWRRVRNTGNEKYVNSTTNGRHRHAQDSAIDLASQAVLNEGLSLQKAALKYEISKTVLWRRVRKHPDYMKTARENPVVVKAYDRLKSGESLKSISQDLDIPMSTLHRHKVRLSQQGQLPEFVKCRRRDTNSKDDLKLKLAKAVHACIHEGMSQNQAAHLFDISKSTLWRHLQKRLPETELIDVHEHCLETIDEDDIKEEVILS